MNADQIIAKAREAGITAPIEKIGEKAIRVKSKRTADKIRDIWLTCYCFKKYGGEYELSERH